MPLYKNVWIQWIDTIFAYMRFHGRQESTKAFANHYKSPVFQPSQSKAIKNTIFQINFSALRESILLSSMEVKAG